MAMPRAVERGQQRSHANGELYTHRVEIPISESHNCDISQIRAGDRKEGKPLASPA